MSQEELSLSDLAPEDRKVLKHNDSFLDKFAAQVEEKYNLLPGILLALKNAGEKSESTGKNSVSPKGATGVMQFMPGTAKEMGLADATDPLEAIDGAGRYVAQLQERFGKDKPHLIAAAYNAGPNRKSLERGEVPLIPETKEYVKRVMEHMGSRPVEGGTFTITPNDLTPEDRTKVALENYDPTEGMSTLDKTLAGAGKFFADTGHGAKQLAADYLLNPLSQKFTGKDLMPGLREEEAERRRRDAPLMNTGAGMAGYGGAAALMTAIPGSWISRAAPVARAAQAASRIPLLGAAAELSVPAAASSGALAALQPVSEAGERGRNMAEGAAFGAVAAPVGALAGNLAAKYAAPAVRALGEKVNIPGAWKPSFMAGANQGERDAVLTAMEQGVPVYGSQLRNPGASVSKGRTLLQRSEFDRAIARSFGEDTDDLVKAFPSAQQRLSDTFNKVLDGKTIALDKGHIADLKAVSAFNSSKSPRFAPNADLDDYVERAIAAAKKSKTMSGRDYQEALRDYKALMVKFSQGTEKNPSDPHAAKGVGMLIDALTKQAEKTLTGEELKAFRTANKQWRNMSQLESLAPKGADGSIDPKQLANVLARKRKGEFVYGKGDQTLPNLARYGNSYMGVDAAKPRGLMAQGKEFARSTAPFVAGDVAGAYLMGNAMGGEHAPADSMAGELVKYGALGLLTHGALRAGSNAMNPRLTRPDLFTPRGALGETFSRMQPGAALWQTHNAGREEQE